MKATRFVKQNILLTLKYENLKSKPFHYVAFIFCSLSSMKWSELFILLGGAQISGQDRQKTGSRVIWGILLSWNLLVFQVSKCIIDRSSGWEGQRIVPCFYSHTFVTKTCHCLSHICSSFQTKLEFVPTKGSQ